MNTTDTTTLLCRSLQVPTPEQVKEALCQAGCGASIESESGSLVTRLDVDLRYASDKMPITIWFYAERIYNNKYTMGHDEWRWFNDIMPENMEQKDILRFISVKAQADVDTGALQAVVDCIVNQADAVVAVEKPWDGTSL